MMTRTNVAITASTSFAPIGIWKALAEARRQFFVNATKAAVGKNGNDIASAKLRGDRSDDRVGVGEEFSFRATFLERLHDLVGLETFLFRNTMLLIDVGEYDAIGEPQAFHQIAGQNFAAQRIGSRLEHGPEARMRINSAESAQGFADGGGMVSEIFNHSDIGNQRTGFQPSLHALEGGQCGADYVGANALACGERSGSGGIEGVMFAGHTHLEIGPASPAVVDFPSHEAVFVAKIANAPVTLLKEAVSLHAAKCVRDAVGDIFAGIVGDNDATARDQIDQPLERGFHGIEIGVDVGMVVFHMGKDEAIGKIVQKLGALIKKGGVVFVAFENEVLRGTQLETGAEIFRHAADEE